jgi:acetyl esterase
MNCKPVNLLLVLAAFCTLLTKSNSQEKNVEPSLDSQSKAFIAALAESKKPGFHELPVAEGRKAFEGLTQLFGTGPDDVSIEDRRLAEVPVRIYRPKALEAKNLPAVVYFHGGGFVFGSIETHDALCRRLCSESKAALVSVGYRMAPEHPYPAPLNDCYEVTQYVAEHTSELGFHPKKIVVAGDSAGGGLAAAVAIKARNTSGPKIRAQVLIYPAVDAACDSKTYALFAQGFGLSKSAMQWYWKQYLGDKEPKVYSSPAKAQSFKDLPETILITAQYDVLREEGEVFAKKLQESGVKVAHRRYDGVLHGFVHFAGAFDQGKSATSDIAKQLKTLFASE